MGLIDDYTDKQGRIHDHPYPDFEGRPGCRACSDRLHEPVASAVISTKPLTQTDIEAAYRALAGQRVAQSVECGSLFGHAALLRVFPPSDGLDWMERIAGVQVRVDDSIPPDVIEVRDQDGSVMLRMRVGPDGSITNQEVRDDRGREDHPR